RRRAAGADHIAAGVLLAIAQFGGLIGRPVLGTRSDEGRVVADAACRAGFGNERRRRDHGAAGPQLAYPALVATAFPFD
ncbi:MAG: hypothetical protein HOP09_10830, partial [Hyphomicrobium sp.]|nr:hypothetical protein [Hyphomicrobium sp.]